MDNKKGRNIAVLTIFLCIFSFISDKLSTKYSLGMIIFHKLLLPAIPILYVFTVGQKKRCHKFKQFTIKIVKDSKDFLKYKKIIFECKS